MNTLMKLQYITELQIYTSYLIGKYL